MLFLLILVVTLIQYWTTSRYAGDGHGR
jgi:hypothetical protein